MHEFTKALQQKGWSAKEVSARWGITARAFSMIAAAPKQIHLDALAGLEDKNSVDQSVRIAVAVSHAIQEHCKQTGKDIISFAEMREIKQKILRGEDNEDL